MSADVMLHTPLSTIHHKHTPNLHTNAPFPLRPPPLHSAAQQVPVRRAKAVRNARFLLFFFL